MKSPCNLGRGGIILFWALGLVFAPQVTGFAQAPGEGGSPSGSASAPSASLAPAPAAPQTAGVTVAPCPPCPCCCPGCCCGYHQGCLARYMSSVGGFNCTCRGSYKFPVPPQYTYHWPGMYSQQLMTAYNSPYRYPALKLPPWMATSMDTSSGNPGTLAPLPQPIPLAPSPGENKPESGTTP